MALGQPPEKVLKQPNPSPPPAAIKEAAFLIDNAIPHEQPSGEAGYTRGYEN